MRSLRLIVSLGIVGFTEQVIDADAIEAGKLDQNFYGNGAFSCFIVRVSCLSDMQMIRKDGLRVIMIFA